MAQAIRQLQEAGVEPDVGRSKDWIGPMTAQISSLPRGEAAVSTSDALSSGAGKTIGRCMNGSPSHPAYPGSSALPSAEPVSGTSCRLAVGRYGARDSRGDIHRRYREFVETFEGKR